MKFNPTLLECVLFIFVRIAIYIWTKHGRRIRRWLQDYLGMISFLLLTLPHFQTVLTLTRLRIRKESRLGIQSKIGT